MEEFIKGDDLILCQITSQTVKDKYAVSLDDNDFHEGTLKQKSNIRPNRLFIADFHIVLYKVGHLKPQKTTQVIDKIITILK